MIFIRRVLGFAKTSIMPVEIIDLTESPQVLTVQKARAWQRKGHTWQQKAHPIDSLQTAINATSHQQLKLAVLRLVGSQPLAAEYLEKELLASEDNYKNYDDVSTDEETEEEEEEEEDDGDDDDDDDSEKSDDDIVTSIDLRKDAPKALKQQPVAEVVGQKRKRTRFAMCAQCKEEFDITVNYREACDYHPGKCHREPAFISCLDDHQCRRVWLVSKSLSLPFTVSVRG